MPVTQIGMATTHIGMQATHFSTATTHFGTTATRIGTAAIIFILKISFNPAKQHMKGALTKKHIAEQARQVNLLLLVKALAQRNQVSIQHLSQIMGNHGNFLNRALKQKDHHISLLIALSMHLQTNLLENYFPLLPEHLRITRREKELMQQLADAQQQLADVVKERDWLKEVVARK